MVRNENDARRKAGAGSFSVTDAGGETIQKLATKLAKACTQELYDFFLSQKVEAGQQVYRGIFLTVERGFFQHPLSLGR